MFVYCLTHSDKHTTYEQPCASPSSHLCSRETFYSSNTKITPFFSAKSCVVWSTTCTSTTALPVHHPTQQKTEVKTSSSVRARAHVGVAQFQVVEIHRLLEEQRPSVPCAAIELQKLGARDLKNTHPISSRRDVRVTTTRSHCILRSSINERWRRHSKIPWLAADGTQALRHARVVRDLRELERPVLEMHDVEPDEKSIRWIGPSFVDENGLVWNSNYKWYHGFYYSFVINR